MRPSRCLTVISFMFMQAEQEAKEVGQEDIVVERLHKMKIEVSMLCQPHDRQASHKET